MKPSVIMVAVLTIVFVFPVSYGALAHSGGTDSNGGHYDTSTGEYHYHHGYPAHQHENGVCPYDFDDKTGELSGSSSKSESSSGGSDSKYGSIATHDSSSERAKAGDYSKIIVWSIIVLSFAVWVVVKIKKMNIYKEDKRRHNEEKERFRAQYAGKSMREYFSVPANVEIGPDGLPRETGAIHGWGEEFTFYAALHGAVYHRRGCRFTGLHYCRAVHVYKLYGLRPCSLCNPGIAPNHEWLNEYNSIKKQAEYYHVGIVDDIRADTLTGLIQK